MADLDLAPPRASAVDHEHVPVLGAPEQRADRHLEHVVATPQHHARLHAIGIAPADSHGRPAVFRLDGVSKIYRMGEMEVHALRGVDLDLYAGELVVLLGASGSGKSTLLNILGGLDAPTTGEVYYLDHILSGATEEQVTRFRREHMGFVFQFYNLIPSLTALENVSLVTDIAERPLDPEEALRLVGLGERLHHRNARDEPRRGGRE